MKDTIKKLVDDSIKDFDVFIDDCFYEKQEEKNVLNIVVDSNDIIDLNKITDISRIINKAIDNNLKLDVDEVDIYSKEKGDSSNE